MNFGYVFQTSTMALFIQTKVGECRLIDSVGNKFSQLRKIYGNQPGPEEKKAAYKTWVVKIS